MGYSIFMQAETVVWHIAKLVACTVNLFSPLQPATIVFYVRNEHSSFGVAVQQWLWHISFKEVLRNSTKIYKKVVIKTG